MFFDPPSADWALMSRGFGPADRHSRTPSLFRFPAYFQKFYYLLSAIRNLLFCSRRRLRSSQFFSNAVIKRLVA
jgi:hypothetical protein